MHTFPTPLPPPPPPVSSLSYYSPLGQTRPVTVYRLLSESTIEARIIGLQVITPTHPPVTPLIPPPLLSPTSHLF